MDEEELIRLSREGDSSAFEALVIRYQKEIYNLAYRYLNHQEDAADVAQEAFLKAYAGLKRFRGSSSFRTWIYRITINLCSDFTRKKRRTPQIVDLKGYGEEQVEMYTAAGLGPEEEVLVGETRVYLQSLLQELSPEFRMVVILRDVLDFTYEEIARYLECSLGTVKSRLSRGRAMLRGRIEHGRELSPFIGRLNGKREEGGG